MLARLNQVRAAGAQCGGDLMGPAPPLRAQIDAEEAAAAQTTWMQANRTMTHQGAGGSTVGNRLTEAGYDWSAVGENVATGQSSAEAVVSAWLASPGHCRNILDPVFADVGFAFAPATPVASTYATMVLARAR